MLSGVFRVECVKSQTAITMAQPPPLQTPGDNAAKPRNPAAALNRPLGSIRPQPLAVGRGIGNTAAPVTTGAQVPSMTRTGAPRMTFTPKFPLRRKIAQ